MILPQHLVVNILKIITAKTKNKKQNPKKSASVLLLDYFMDGRFGYLSEKLFWSTPMIRRVIIGIPSPCPLRNCESTCESRVIIPNGGFWNAFSRFIHFVQFCTGNICIGLDWTWIQTSNSLEWMASSNEQVGKKERLCIQQVIVLAWLTGIHISGCETIWDLTWPGWNLEVSKCQQASLSGLWNHHPNSIGWGFRLHTVFIVKILHTACPVDHPFTADLLCYLFLCVFLKVLCKTQR